MVRFFDAFSKPELLKRWFGPRGWSLAVCEVDFRVGGGFRFLLGGPDGTNMGMRGVYREIVPPERSVHMESFDDYPGESQVTSVFVEQGGQDQAHRHGALPLPGSARHRHQNRHGARRGGDLRQAGRAVAHACGLKETFTLLVLILTNKEKTQCKRLPRSCGSMTKPKRQ